MLYLQDNPQAVNERLTLLHVNMEMDCHHPISCLILIPAIRSEIRG